MIKIKEKIKILWLSDSPLTCTGFATISKNILNKLPKNKYECHFIGHNYYGQTLIPGTTFEDGTKIDFYVHGTGKQPYSADIIEGLIRELKPDIFGVLLDSFMLMQSGYLNKDLGPAKTIMYYPSDGGSGLPLGCENILRKFHVNVAMARFGQRQVKDVHGIETLCIPHAIDTKVYHPLTITEKNKLKQKYGLLGKFVVGTVARNQGRKMLDRTIKSFARFAKGKDDVMLFCHTDPEDVAQVFNLKELVNRYKLNNKVVFSGMKYFKGFHYLDMNKVYNVMDVFFLSTSGEGFGVPTIEAMGCGIPCVVTDYTTTHELLIEDGKCGLPVKLSGVESAPYGEQATINQYEYDKLLDNGTITGSWNVERGIMDVVDGAKQLQVLYDDVDLRVNLGMVGRRKVLKIYDWSVVIESWIKVFEEMTK